MKKLLKNFLNLFFYLRYLEDIKDFYSTACFSVLTSSVLTISATLVTLMTTDNFFGGFGYLIAMVFEIFVFCVFGAVVQTQVSFGFFHQNQGLIIWFQNELLLANFLMIEWHLLPIPLQKTFRFMIMKAQTTKDFDLLFIGNMDMVAFSEVIFYT